MAEKRRKITKQEAATVQLETAIKLFFENRDLISAYTLCVAADEVLEGIYRNKRNEILRRQHEELSDPNHFRFSWGEECEIRIKSKYRKEFFEKLREPQNFFKHADKDHDDVLEFADVELTGIKIFTTITNYRLVIRDPTPAMSVFFSWYVMVHPNFLADDNPAKLAMDANPLLEGLTERFSHSELAAIGHDNLMKTCPDLFPPTDLLSNTEPPRSNARVRIPSSEG